MLSWSRWLGLAVTLFGLSVVTFAIPRLIPGDPVAVLAAERALPPEARAALLHELELDRPLHEQYVRYVGRMVRGDFGMSYVTKRPVLEEFARRFPATLELTLLAFALGAAFGLAAGYVAALRPHGILDRVVSALAVTLYSTPVFLIGLGLILLLSVQWGLTPVSGRVGVAFFVEPVSGFLLLDTLLAGDTRAFASASRHLILPVLTLATVPFAVLQRMTRHAMIGELGEDYVRVARAKGASAPRAVGHAWRPALVPVIAVGAVTINQMIGGAILTEYVFAWPGLGQWLIEATHRRDYAVLQAALLFVGIAVIAVGLAADALQRRTDPRLGRHL